MSLLSNKKGSSLDIAVIAVVALAMVIMIPLGFMITSQINDAFQTNDQVPTVAKDTVGDFTTSYPSIFDGIFLLIIVGLLLVSIFLASRIDVNPALFFLSMFVLLVLGLLAAAFANAYDTYSNTAAVAPFAASFPIMNFIMGNLVVVLIIYALVLGIVIFAKVQRG